MDNTKCPVCCGSGELYVSEDHDCWGNTKTIYKQCGACRGSGLLDPERYAMYQEYIRLKHLLGFVK